MKAEFKKTKAADGLPLTFGKKYDVQDVKTGKRPWELKEIKVKNDLGQERWYKANKFKLFFETVAYLKEQTAAGTGKSAAQSAMLHELGAFIGIDIAKGEDMAAGFTARKMTKKQREELTGSELQKAVTPAVKMEHIPTPDEMKKMARVVRESAKRGT